MKNKSLAFQIITFVILFASGTLAVGGQLSPTLALWLGVAVSVLTPLTKTFFPTGFLVKGWDAALWITNILTFLMYVGGLIFPLLHISTVIVLLFNQAANAVILMQTEKD